MLLVTDLDLCGVGVSRDDVVDVRRTDLDRSQQLPLLGHVAECRAVVQQLDQREEAVHRVAQLIAQGGSNGLVNIGRIKGKRRVGNLEQRGKRTAREAVSACAYPDACAPVVSCGLTVRSGEFHSEFEVNVPSPAMLPLRDECAVWS